MGKSTSWYPSLKVDGDGAGVVSQAGAVALVRTAAAVGLDRELSQALARWRKPLATHDPGKIVLDLAVTVAVGGDCASDMGMLRGEPGVFGSVASDPTVSRLIDVLGLRNLPFRGFDANRIWLAIVALALDLTAWLQTIALHHHPARRWEPKILRLQLFSISARLTRHARRTHLRLSRHAPHTGLLVTALDRLQPG